MGKALVFKGVRVDAPLQTVTFVKKLITASDYVNEYSKLATSVSSEQKTNLVTFVTTLMNNNLWDKVRCCFPMLGGMEGYNKDLKDVFNQRVWNAPVVGTSWDSTRNAPYLNLPGKAKGTCLVIENLDKTNSTFLFSVKLGRLAASVELINEEYKYISTSDKHSYSFISGLYNSNGGYAYPYWDTGIKNESISGYTYDAQANNIYMVTLNKGTNSLFVCSNSSTLLTVGTGVTPESEVTNASFAFGNYYDAVMEAPANSTLKGCMNMFIAFNSALTEEELQVVSKAVWDFDEACGRHIDFTD